MADKEDGLDDTLTARVNANELDIFKRKSLRITGKPYQLFLREMITAFNDGRLTIIETEEAKREKKGLYK